MRYISEIGLELSIEDSLLQKLIKEGRKLWPNETGGILVGRYSVNLKMCHVEDFIIPLKNLHSPNIFERGTAGVSEQLSKYYNQEPRLLYVGEWHTHPHGSPEPSKMDLLAMKKISRDENVKISNPILIIIGLSKKSASPGIFIYFNEKLLKYEPK